MQYFQQYRALIDQREAELIISSWGEKKADECLEVQKHSIET
jgi:hypothetical protein